LVTLGGLAVLLIGVLWGAIATPGLPFTWTMYSGSSKALLHIRHRDGSRPATQDELGLSPEAHYLLEAHLRAMAESSAPALPALDGMIVGSRGSWTVSYDGAGTTLHTSAIAYGEDLEQLAAELRRYSCEAR
jgi:hypothetical protein